MMSFDEWHKSNNNGKTFSQKWEGRELSRATTALGDDLSAYITYAVASASSGEKPDIVQEWSAAPSGFTRQRRNNLRLTYDGLTGKLKAAEVI